MAKKSAAVDAYIAKSADFAKPILKHLRKLVHGACPDVEEEMKWSFPHFSYQGMFCGMAAFRQHATFGCVTSLKDRVLTIPDYFMKALNNNKKALATFDAFPYSNKKEYVAWVVEAKAEATRDKRLAQAVEWMSEGNWKYENC